MDELKAEFIIYEGVVKGIKIISKSPQGQNILRQLFNVDVRVTSVHNNCSELDIVPRNAQLKYNKV